MAETFGEDPLVNANMGAAHVRGLQGGDGSSPGTYLKAAATCKVRWQRCILVLLVVLPAPCPRPPPLNQPAALQAICFVHRQLLPANRSRHSLNYHPTPPPIPSPQHFIGNDLEGWTDASGRFVTRHNFDARISDADMRDSFLPPFEACVQDAQAASFMCSYNRGELSRGSGG